MKSIFHFLPRHRRINSCCRHSFSRSTPQNWIRTRFCEGQNSRNWAAKPKKPQHAFRNKITVIELWFLSRDREWSGARGKFEWKVKGFENFGRLEGIWAGSNVSGSAEMNANRWKRWKKHENSIKLKKNENEREKWRKMKLLRSSYAIRTHSSVSICYQSRRLTAPRGIPRTFCGHEQTTCSDVGKQLRGIWAGTDLMEFAVSCADITKSKATSIKSHLS